MPLLPPLAPNYVRAHQPHHSSPPGAFASSAMGFLPRNSFAISHLSKLSPFPTPHTRVPSPSSSSPRPPKDLMGTDSSGASASGSEEGEDQESAEDLERILLSLWPSSDEDMEAPPSALGDVGYGWAMDDGDGGFLELRDLDDGELEGEGEGEEEEELGDGEVIDGDAVLDDFGVLELELMEVDDSSVGLE